MGPPLSPRQGIPSTVNSTVNTSPFFPDGKSPGAACTAPTDELGKVLASNRAASSASRSYQRQIVFFAGFAMSLLHRERRESSGLFYDSPGGRDAPSACDLGFTAPAPALSASLEGMSGDG